MSVKESTRIKLAGFSLSVLWEVSGEDGILMGH